MSENLKSKIIGYANEEGIFTKDFEINLDSYAFLETIWILSCKAKYTTLTAAKPTLQYGIADREGNLLYQAFPYVIGEREESVQRQWRVPMIRGTYDTVRIHISIPEGVTLSIDEFEMRENTMGEDENNAGITYISHTGLLGYAPENTAESFRIAGEMGYKKLITIVKFTKDNIPVCLHDDDSIKRHLTRADGTRIQAGDPDDKPVEAFTYEELQQFSAGWKKSEVYKDCKVPKLEEYFQICSEYGMDPIFSVHPSLTVEQWQTLKAMLKQYDLLERFYVKTGDLDELKKTLPIFGDEIGGYTLIMPYNQDYSLYSVAKRAGFVKEDNPEEVDFERYDLSAAYFQHANNLETVVQRAKEEGFPGIEVYGIMGISGPEFERLHKLGVNIFALDYHASVGLRW